jgi:hypothetical protein
MDKHNVVTDQFDLLSHLELEPEKKEDEEEEEEPEDDV